MAPWGHCHVFISCRVVLVAVLVACECGGMAAIGIADGMSIARVWACRYPPRRSFWVPARPYPRNGHAVGDADIPIRDCYSNDSLKHGCNPEVDRRTGYKTHNLRAYFFFDASEHADGERRGPVPT